MLVKVEINVPDGGNVFLLPIPCVFPKSVLRDVNISSVRILCAQPSLPGLARQGGTAWCATSRVACENEATGVARSDKICGGNTDN